MFLNNFCIFSFDDNLYGGYIYSLKNEIKVDYQELTELKQCMLLSCDKSQGNNTRDICKNIAIKSRKGEVCVSI